MVDSSEELYEGRVLRFAFVGPTFPLGSRKPFPEHFTFNTMERAQILDGHRALLSVWDEARTTVAQARALRCSSTDAVAFRLDVAAVRSISVTGCSPLRVLRDPLPDRRPGADGHCGIDGLGETACPNRTLRRVLKAKLVQIAVRVDE